MLWTQQWTLCSKQKWTHQTKSFEHNMLHFMIESAWKYWGFESNLLTSIIRHFVRPGESTSFTSIGSQVRVLLRPPTQESPCKIRDFLLFCPLPRGVQNEHSYRVHSIDVNGLSFTHCSPRVDVNGLAVRVASLLVFDVNSLSQLCGLS